MSFGPVVMGTMGLKTMKWRDVVLRLQLKPEAIQLKLKGVQYHRKILFTRINWQCASSGGWWLPIVLASVIIQHYPGISSLSIPGRIETVVKPVSEFGREEME